MRSRLCFVYPGILGCLWIHVEILIDFEQQSRSAINQDKHDKRGEIWITCGSIHQGHEWFSDDSRGRQDIFMCLAALLCEQFCRFANGGAKISTKFYFFSQCIQQQWTVRQKCLLQLASPGKKREEGVKPTCIMSKSDFGTTDKSFTLFFTCWGV